MILSHIDTSGRVSARDKVSAQLLQCIALLAPKTMLCASWQEKWHAI
jgi:hypothetical protein